MANQAPSVTILAASSYAAGTRSEGRRVGKECSSQGVSDIYHITIYDRNMTGGAVMCYNGSIITPGGAAACGFTFDYANRTLLSNTVGSGSNHLVLNAFDQPGAVRPIATWTGTETSSNNPPSVTILAASSYAAGT